MRRLMAIVFTFVVLATVANCSKPGPNKVAPTSRSEPVVSVHPLEGLYLAKETDDELWLRFYRDGTVLEVSTNTGTPAEINKWFNKTGSKAVSVGSYEVKQSFLSFSVTSLPNPLNVVGTVDYKGKIVGNTLVLDWYSHINGHRSHNVYRAVLPISTPENSGVN